MWIFGTEIEIHWLSPHPIGATGWGPSPMETRGKLKHVPRTMAARPHSGRSSAARTTSLYVSAGSRGFSPPHRTPHRAADLGQAARFRVGGIPSATHLREHRPAVYLSG